MPDLTLQIQTAGGVLMAGIGVLVVGSCLSLLAEFTNKRDLVAPMLAVTLAVGSSCMFVGWMLLTAKSH